MTRYKLLESGFIMMLPGADVPGEAEEVLGKALCMNSEKLARSVGVPEDQILKCKKGNIPVIEHNLNAAGEYLKHM